MNQDVERFGLSDEGGHRAYEYLHRYALTCDLAAGKRVLDIACGEGYGTHLLAQTAAEAVGVDFDSSSIRGAKRRFRRSNLTYIAADANIAADTKKLPFEPGSFDISVAHHINDDTDLEALLAEAKRVLRAGGTFIVSLPLRPTFRRDLAKAGPHGSGMSLVQLQELLTRHYENVEVTGLRMALMSVGFRIGQSVNTSNLASAKIYQGHSVQRKFFDIRNEELKLEQPSHVLAICSDKALDLACDSSLFFSPDHDVWLREGKTLSEASHLREQEGLSRQALDQARGTAVASKTTVGHAELERLDHALIPDASNVGQPLDGPFHIAATAKLLTRLSGGPVTADPASILEALFVLNEQLVTQRFQIQAAAETSRRAADLEVQLAALRQASQDRIDIVLQEKDTLRASLAETAELVRKAEKMADDLRSESMRVGQERESLRRGVSQAEAACARTEGELTAMRRALTEARSLTREMEQELAAARLESSRKGQELTHLTRQHDAQTKAAAQFQEEVRTMTRTISSLEVSNHRLEERLEAEGHELNKVREEARQGREEIKRLAKKVAELVQDREVLVKAKERLAVADSARAENQAHSQVTDKEQPLDRRRQASDGASAALKQKRRRFYSTQQSIKQQLEQASVAARSQAEFLPPASAPNTRRRLLGRRSNPLDTVLFDPAWIKSRYGLSGITLTSFLSKPRFFRMDPHPLFGAEFYLDANPDVASSGVSPLFHYINQGWREGRNPHPYFASDWYLYRNPDILKSVINPLDHYLRFGWREGRWPNPAFDPIAYLDRHPDVRKSGFEPLTHFVTFGIEEDREIPLQGLGLDWRSLVVSDKRSILDVLLDPARAPLDPPEPAGFTAAVRNLSLLSSSNAGAPASWPPHPLEDYWLPQDLRDYIIEANGTEYVPLYQFLCSVMASFNDREEDFLESSTCALLMSRVRTLAARSADTAEQVDATIIIPVYNHLLDTLLSIVSILENETNCNYEIIVADDSSTDETAAVFSAIGGVVRHVRNARNLGFLANCNAAAEKAAGRYIVLLNNDTLVLPGWLDQLIAPFERERRVGLVGSKLINWNGSLQEAGGIFWQDGSAWNFGRGQDALAPEFNYLKDVDYCSGASIALPASLWREVGGFDMAFAPAYCEDSDLAFRLRKLGYRALYSPQSVVIHHEGRSHGRDIDSGIKAYQIVNQRTLFDRWREVLAAEHYPNAENVLRARDRSGRRKHVLVIDHYVPQWDRDAGSRTIFQYLEILLQLDVQVTFWPDNLFRDPVYTPVLQAMGIEVIYGLNYQDRFEDFMRDRSDLYDAIFLSRPHVAQRYVGAIRRHSSARLLYYGHDLHFRRMEASKLLGTAVDDGVIDSTRAMELEVCAACDVIFYPDPEEIERVRAEVGGDRLFIPNPVFVYDVQQIAAARARLPAVRNSDSQKLVFVGGFNHAPNREGVIWFVTEVLPIVIERLPGVELHIAGSNPPPEVYKLASQNVFVLGLVPEDDLTRLYLEAGLAVAPLLHGAGVKGKVIEAMALGVPLATTSVGAQGIRNASDFLFVGDSPEELADAIVAALTERGQAALKAEGALQFIEANYARAAMKDLFEQLLKP